MDSTQNFHLLKNREPADHLPSTFAMSIRSLQQHLTRLTRALKMERLQSSLELTCVRHAHGRSGRSAASSYGRRQLMCQSAGLRDERFYSQAFRCVFERQIPSASLVPLELFRIAAVKNHGEFFVQVIDGRHLSALVGRSLLAGARLYAQLDPGFFPRTWQRPARYELGSGSPNM